MLTSAQFEENHARFMQYLKASEDDRWRQARWLSMQGYNVWLAPTIISPTVGQRRWHADKGDIYITPNRPNPLSSKRIEGKGLSYDFTSRTDWPHNDFMVCNCASFDAAQPKPVTYIILNRARTHAAFVHTSTASTWERRLRTDGRFIGGTPHMNYHVPLDTDAIVWRPLAGDHREFLREHLGLPSQDLGPWQWGDMMVQVPSPPLPEEASGALIQVVPDLSHLPADPHRPGKHIDPATGIWPMAEWGAECRRGFNR